MSQNLTDPFIKKDTYNSNAYLNKETLEYLFARLKQLGLSEIQIKTPIAIVKGAEQSQKTITTAEVENIFTENEFLKQERNYSAIIITAKNSSKKEEIKILIRNQFNADLVFHDDVFNLVNNSKNTNMFISTPHPTTTYSYTAFIKDFFTEQAKGRNGGELIPLIIAVLLITTSLIYLHIPPISLIFYFFVLAVFIFAIITLLPQGGFNAVSRKRNIPAAFAKLKTEWLVLVLGAVLTELIHLLFSLIPHH